MATSDIAVVVEILLLNNSYTLGTSPAVLNLVKPLLPHCRPPTPMSTPEILLFARGVVALLDLWPALTIAVREEWGGPESADKKTWLASELIDAFEAAVVSTPAGPAIAPNALAEPPLDVDQVADLLTQIMSDEFEAAIEDDSVDPLASDILRLWKDVLQPEARPAEETVGALERKAAEVAGRVQAQNGGGPVDEDGDEWESDSGSEDEEEAVPQLVESAPRERQEPVVDDDGFTLVQKPRRR